jgi:hypothetical protein
MIRVTWYFWSGRESHSHDCTSVEEAFERLVRTGMYAIVYPVGTTSGLYNWDHTKQGHTLEGLKAKLALCEPRQEVR